MAATLEIFHGDVLRTACDVLVLKYANAFHGADQRAAAALGLGATQFGPGPGESELLSSDAKLACRHVLFYGVGPLAGFRYREIRDFARQALATVDASGVDRAAVAMTMHGVGAGLDVREAFNAQLAGILEYLSAAPANSGLRRVMIVEWDPGRCQRLREILQKVLAESGFDPTGERRAGVPVGLPDAGIRSDAKKHVFVAMPFDDEMADVFEFGIKEPVNEAAYLCERCDKDMFTGDILERIKGRITSASVVIADVTGSNPNVYLEVGYAWGKGVPTLLIARQGEELKFDVKTQKCIYYKSISHLRKQLVDYMASLRNVA